MQERNWKTDKGKMENRKTTMGCKRFEVGKMSLWRCEDEKIGWMIKIWEGEELAWIKYWKGRWRTS